MYIYVRIKYFKIFGTFWFLAKNRKSKEITDFGLKQFRSILSKNERNCKKRFILKCTKIFVAYIIFPPN